MCIVEDLLGDDWYFSRLASFLATDLCFCINVSILLFTHNLGDESRGHKVFNYIGLHCTNVPQFPILEQSY